MKKTLDDKARSQHIFDAMSDKSIAEAIETDPDARLLDAADF